MFKDLRQDQSLASLPSILLKLL